MSELKVKKLSETATIPTYGTTGAACFDLYADKVELTSYGVLVGTGLAFDIPDGYVMMVYSRSGMGFKSGIVLRNATGVVDSDYIGEVKVALTANNLDISEEGNEFSASALVGVQHGDRIAQAMIIPVQQYNFVEVDEITETTRGAGGFGSTGS